MANCHNCERLAICHRANPEEIICSSFKAKSITNYDRVIGKTPEELAKWLWFRVGKCPPFDVCPSPSIPCEPKDCWLDWLKQKEE